MARKEAMQRRFNPGSYREDFLDLIKTNPDLAAQSATKLAGRKVRAENQVTASDTMTSDLIASMFTFLVMGGAGWWQGSLKAKRDILVADWQLEGAESIGASLQEHPKPWSHESGVSNPMTWWMIPKLMVLPFGTGLLALVASSMRKKGGRPGAFEKSMTLSAVGTFGLTIASMVGSYSYEKKEAKMTASPVESTKAVA